MVRRSTRRNRDRCRAARKGPRPSRRHVRTPGLPVLPLITPVKINSDAPLVAPGHRPETPADAPFREFVQRQTATIISGIPIRPTLGRLTGESDLPRSGLPAAFRIDTFDAVIEANYAPHASAHF